MTMKDVAKRAGVSLSTVSYVISGNRPISEEKKMRVHQAMEELGYRPHAIARSLASKRTRILALLFPSVERGMGLSELNLLTCAARAATQEGYHLVFWSLEGDSPDELQSLIGQELVDGVILMEVHNDDFRIPILREANIPFVLVGRDDSAGDVPYVDTDFDKTILDALSYLVEKGHEGIGFINQSREVFDEGYGPVVRTQQAFDHYCRMFRFCGHSLFCPPDSRSAYDLVLSDLAEHPECTAYIVMNDRILDGVLQALAASSRSVPADCSVVSIVSSASSATLYLPALTAFEIQGEQQMSVAVHTLIARLEDSYNDRNLSLIPCVLVERESVSVPSR